MLSWNHPSESISRSTKLALVERLDGGFIPLDWLANPAPALRELALHRHIAKRKVFTPELRGLGPAHAALPIRQTASGRPWLRLIAGEASPRTGQGMG